MKMTCVNACSDKEYWFMLKPSYTCGHVMCFNSGMAMDWCIKCGCKTKNNVSFCHAFNELLSDNDDEPQTTTTQYNDNLQQTT